MSFPTCLWALLLAWEAIKRFKNITPTAILFTFLLTVDDSDPIDELYLVILFTTTKSIEEPHRNSQAHLVLTKQ